MVDMHELENKYPNWMGLEPSARMSYLRFMFECLGSSPTSNYKHILISRLIQYLFIWKNESIYIKLSSSFFNWKKNF